jgi:hypothetical protein
LEIALRGSAGHPDNANGALATVTRPVFGKVVVGLVAFGFVCFGVESLISAWERRAPAGAIVASAP